MGFLPAVAPPITCPRSVNQIVFAPGTLRAWKVLVPPPCGRWVSPPNPAAIASVDTPRTGAIRVAEQQTSTENFFRLRSRALRFPAATSAYRGGVGHASTSVEGASGPRRLCFILRNPIEATTGPNSSVEIAGRLGPSGARGQRGPARRRDFATSAERERSGDKGHGFIEVREVTHPLSTVTGASPARQRKTRPAWRPKVFDEIWRSPGNSTASLRATRPRTGQI